MPFGVKNAGQCYFRLVELSIMKLRSKNILAYIDDIICCTQDLLEHLKELGDIFRMHREAGIKIRAEKTHLFRREVEYLGYDVSEEGGINNFVRAKLIAKQKGVICGQIVINRMLDKHAPNCSYDWKVGEGELVKERGHVLQISGFSCEILKVERVMLNLLGRLSGISTTTSEWVSNSNDLQLACTRKTEWGILDKWAVHIGGGLTHRLFRSDALMLKENDFASAIESGEDQNDSIKKHDNQKKT